MKIGVAAENRPNEKRVILSPPDIKRLAKRYEVIVEKNAGAGLGISDAAYVNAGCKIGTHREVYGCDIVVRIKEPSFEEIKLLRRGAIVMAMMHIRCAPKLEAALRERKVIAIPLDAIKDATGRRKVEALEASGRIGMEYAFQLWGKDPSTAVVKVMGYGNVAVGAIRAAARHFAHVEVLNKRDFMEMQKHLPGTDILVDGVNRPYRREVAKEPPFVTRKMLKLLKPGSVIVDLVSNPENHAPVETMRPTTLADLHYVVDGIYHTSCWGWPGLEPDAISRRYCKQLVPILGNLAHNGIDKCDASTRAAMVRFDLGWEKYPDTPAFKGD